MHERALNNTLAFFFLTLFVFLAVSSALRESLTYDEIVHVEEGINALVYNTFTIDVVNPPFIKELAVLPLIVGIAPPPGALPNVTILPARFVIVLFGVILLLWIRSVLPKLGLGSAVVFALAITALEPNMLAHAHYVTLDFGYTVAVFVVYSFYLHEIVPGNQNPKTFLLFGILVGITLATKVTALFVLPAIFGVSALTVYGRKTLTFFWERRKGFFFSIVTSLVVLWGVYFFQFDTVIAPGGDETRISRRLFHQAQESNNLLLMRAITTAEAVKIPMGTYAAMVKNSFIYGRQQGSNVFFLGEFHSMKRFYYDLVVLLLKTPIPLLFMVFFSTIYFALSNQRRTILFMWIPVLVTLFVSYIGKVQPAVRYMLPLFPFLCVIAAMGMPHLYKRHTFLVWILGIWYAVGTLSSFPHFITYANELAGPPRERYRLLADSNLDWGQGLITLNEYVIRNNPSSVKLSFSGRDDAASYGFPSSVPYGSYKADEICAFHPVEWGGAGRALAIISVTNWYFCGYKENGFPESHIADVVSNAFLVFNQ